MISFEKLLKENREDIEKAKKLEDYFQRGGFLNTNQNLLYRGAENENVNYFEIKKIRKDRVPMNVPDEIQRFVDFISRMKYSEIPLRSESKFASTKRKEAELYGKIYVVFPEKDARIVSFNEDAYLVLPRGLSFLKSAKKFLDDEISIGAIENKNSDIPFKSNLNASEVVKKFIGGLAYFYQAGFVPDQLKNVILNYDLKEIINHLKSFRKKISDYYADSVNFIINELRKFISYFKNSIKGQITKDADEVMFDGKKYLLIEENFFHKYFEYISGEWQIKQQYQKQ